MIEKRRQKANNIRANCCEHLFIGENIQFRIFELFDEVLF